MLKLNLIENRNIKPPKDDDYLWRYIDIHKFIDLLQNKIIRFIRMDQFTDPLEGIPIRALLIYNKKFIGDEIHHLRLSELIIDNSLLEKLPGDLKQRLLDIYDIQRSTFLSCWFYEQNINHWNW